MSAYDEIKLKLKNGKTERNLTVFYNGINVPKFVDFEKDKNYIVLGVNQNRTTTDSREEHYCSDVTYNYILIDKGYKNKSIMEFCQHIITEPYSYVVGELEKFNKNIGKVFDGRSGKVEDSDCFERAKTVMGIIKTYKDNATYEELDFLKKVYDNTFYIIKFGIDERCQDYSNQVNCLIPNGKFALVGKNANNYEQKYKQLMGNLQYDINRLPLTEFINKWEKESPKRLELLKNAAEHDVQIRNKIVDKQTNKIKNKIQSQIKL